MTLTSTNKDCVVAYYERVVGGGRLEEIPQFIAESYVDHNAPDNDQRGPAIVEAHLRAIRTTFPDFALHIHEVLGDGDWVALRVTAEGTHQGEWLGIKPTNRRISLRGINLDRVVDGRIVEHWGEADTVGMLVQMGRNPFAG